MLVYRIALTRYASSLTASGRAARWNPNEVDMIYTASSRSLACLENVVHRSQLGLNQLFSVMTIQVSDLIPVETISLNDLPHDWKEFNQMPFTQKLGEDWVKKNGTAVLQVPSSIIDKESNYLLNPKNPNFKNIELVRSSLLFSISALKPYSVA